MGMYEHDFVGPILERTPGEFRHAIETGTCLGYSTRRLSKIFQIVDTIELSPALSSRTKSEMLREGYENVLFHVGDSAEILRRIIPSLRKDACLFYLDAHWSGDASVDWARSDWKGYGVPTAHLGDAIRPTTEEQVPLLYELRAIADTFRGTAVVSIDDFALFGPDGRGLRDRGFLGNDWSGLSIDKLKEACGDRILEWIESPDGHQLAIVLRDLAA